MQDRNIETLILEQLGRQNKLMFDRILPRIESHEERLSRLEAAISELIAQNLDELKAKRNPDDSDPMAQTIITSGDARAD